MGMQPAKQFNMPVGYGQSGQNTLNPAAQTQLLPQQNFMGMNAMQAGGGQMGQPGMPHAPKPPNPRGGPAGAGGGFWGMPGGRLGMTR